MKEAVSLTEMGSTSSSQEAKKTDPSMVSSCNELLRSEEFWFCTGCSTSLMSTMGAGVIAGERGGRERRHAVFFIPWTMVSCRRSEKFITKQGGNTLKTLFTRLTLGGCKRRQSVLETKSHAIISNSTVSPDCDERVISQRGKLTFYQRSTTSRSTYTTSASQEVLGIRRNCTGTGTKVTTTMLKESRDTAGNTMS